MPAVTGETDLGLLYRRAREQVADLVRSLSPEQLELDVPSCPGWTVHGVVSHLTGVATDAANGQLRSVPTPEQTAAQVQERAGTPTSVVLREWERSGSQLEMLLTRSSGSMLAPVIDVAVHEHDIRGAVGSPGNREGVIIELALNRALERFASKVDSAGLAPVRFVDDQGALIAGPPDAPVFFQASRFELFRSIYGRRSEVQIARRFQGSDQAGAYPSLLCIFGPAAADIIE